MIRRPLPYFIRWMHREEPPDNERPKLLRRFRKGGVKQFEKDLSARMEGVSIKQIYWTDPETKEPLIWVYVGDSWWCRKRKKGDDKGYEFARLVAIVNKDYNKLVKAGQNDAVVIDGLWDSRRHEDRPEPEIVYDSIGVQGIIVAYNEYEVVVEWDVNGKRSLPHCIYDINTITFKYEEDYKKYKKIFDTIAKYRSLKTTSK